MEVGEDNTLSVLYADMTNCAPKKCHFSKRFAINLQLQTAVDSGCVLQLGNKPSRNLDRMTLFFFLNQKNVAPSLQAFSQETCWCGRDVKRHLNVSSCFHKCDGTAVLREKYQERLVTSGPAGKSRQTTARLCASPPLFGLGTCVPGLCLRRHASQWEQRPQFDDRSRHWWNVCFCFYKMFHKCFVFWTICFWRWFNNHETKYTEASGSALRSCSV